MSWRRRPTRDMIGSTQRMQLVSCEILTHHTACHAPPDVTILRMHISSESLCPPSRRDSPSEWRLAAAAAPRPAGPACCSLQSKESATERTPHTDICLLRYVRLDATFHSDSTSPFILHRYFVLLSANELNSSWRSSLHSANGPITSLIKGGKLSRRRSTGPCSPSAVPQYVRSVSLAFRSCYMDFPRFKNAFL